jgi:hypothetical protein
MGDSAKETDTEIRRPAPNGAAQDHGRGRQTGHAEKRFSGLAAVFVYQPLIRSG